jgi:hypothetical protein
MPPRCHDLAQFGDVGGRRNAAERGRGAAEKAAETRREMAVAGEPRIERDGGERSSPESRTASSVCASRSCST